MPSTLRAIVIGFAIFWLALVQLNLNIAHGEQSQSKQSVAIDQESIEREIKETQQLLDDGDRDLKFSESRNATILLGNSGAGKSTLTQFLTKKLEDLEAYKNGVNYLIRDKEGLIGNVTLKSQTLVPNLIIDHQQNDAVFYDCPGFGDKRSPSHDIASTYLVKQVTDHVDYIKLVFVIGYPSVRKGLDRYDFERLVRHATKLIPNLEKFSNGIGMVVTKVDNQFGLHNGKPVLIPDEKVIGGIVDFLKEARDYFADRQQNGGLAQEERDFSSKAIELIDIFTKQDPTDLSKYPKITIFRRPLKQGTLAESPPLRSNKHDIERMIFNELQFTNKTRDDFHYTIATESLLYVEHISAAINDQGGSLISQTVQEIGDYHSQSAKKISEDLTRITSDPWFAPEPDEAEKFVKLSSTISHLFEELHTLLKTETDASKIADNLKGTLASKFKSVKINGETIGARLRDVSRYFNWIGFLQLVSGRQMAKVSLELGGRIPGVAHQTEDERKQVANSSQSAANAIIVDIDDKFTEAKNHILDHVKKFKTRDLKKALESISQLNKMLTIMIQELESGLANNSTASFMAAIYETHLPTQNIELPDNWLSNVQNLEKKLPFINRFHISKKAQFDYDLPRQGIRDLIRDTQNDISWYENLVSLTEHIQTYEFQRQKAQSPLANIPIRDSNWQQLLNAINAITGRDVSLAPTDDRLMDVRQIVETMVTEPVANSCPGNDRLIIHGHFVFLDHINQFTCSYPIKWIVIHALNTLFIDKDFKMKTQVQITTIAPKVKVVGTPFIDLNGAKGHDPLPAKAINLATDYERPSWTGRAPDGTPGKSGSSGGSFYLTALETDGIDRVKIEANGGQGGKGQDGADGVPRDPLALQYLIDREIPDQNPYAPPGYLEECHDHGGKSGESLGKLFHNEWSEVCDIYLTDPPSKVQDGGNGGRGGNGGLPGYAKILSLKDRVAKNLEMKSGSRGPGGNGGSSGQLNGCTGKGFHWEVERDLFGKDKTGPIPDGPTHCGHSAGGSPGSNDINEMGAEVPSDGVFERENALVFSEYKEFAGRHLGDRIHGPLLGQMLLNMDLSPDLENLYDTDGLLEDFVRHEESITPSIPSEELDNFYTRYMGRVTRYVSAHPALPAPQRHALEMAYTGAFMKIAEHRNPVPSTYLVTDIEGYLNLLYSNVQAFEKSASRVARAQAIGVITNQMHEEIKDKIDRAKDIIENQLRPQMGQVENEIRLSIRSLANETEERRLRVIDQYRELKEIQRRIIEAQSGNKFLKNVAKVVNFVSTLSNLATKLADSIDVLNNVGDRIIGGLRRATIDRLNEVKGLFTDIVNFPQEFAHDLAYGYKHALDNVLDEFRNAAAESVKDFVDTVDNITRIPEELIHQLGSRVKNLGQVAQGLKNATVDELKGILQTAEDVAKIPGQVLNETATNFKKALDELSGRREEQVKQGIEASKKMAKDSKVTESKPEEEAQTSDSESGQSNEPDRDSEAVSDGDSPELREIENRLKQLRAEHERLWRMEAALFDTLVPLVTQGMAVTEIMSRAIEDKDGPVLDLASWRIGKHLRATTRAIQGMFGEMSSTTYVVGSTNELNELFNTMVKVYDRIDGYRDQRRLGDFISAIANAQNSPLEGAADDPQLNSLINRVDAVMRAQLVLSRYKMAIASVRQWMYPFACTMLSEVPLPQELKMPTSESAGTTDLAIQGARDIENLKDKVQEYKTTIQHQDRYITLARFSSDHPVIGPFYRWDAQEFNASLTKLFSGDPIKLEAKIANVPLFLNAVKFTKINARFRGKDAKSQTVIDRTLANYSISMEHSGLSYYRFNGKYHLVETRPIEMACTFDKHETGPVACTVTTSKLNAGDALLSPYTTWKLELYDPRASLAAPLGPQVKSLVPLLQSVELEGDGIYVAARTSTAATQMNQCTVETEYAQIEQ